MPDGSTRGTAPSAKQHMMGFPAAALGIWSPWLVGAGKLNAEFQEGFGTLASEWQKFVRGRLKEDITFLQRMIECRTPDQAWAVHAEFWQKATDDYGREYLLIGKLAGTMTSKAVAAAQSVTKVANEEMLQLPRAM